jgi:hypothetical protein
MKKAFLLSLISVLVISNSIPLVASASGSNAGMNLPGGRDYVPGVSADGASPPAASLTFLCNPGPGIPSVLYKGPAGGVFLEDYDTGDLLWCNSGHSSVIATPPTGGSNFCYFGMAGMSTSLGLVLVLDTCYNGFWFCLGATQTGCAIESAFMTFPSGFCSTMTSGTCDPDGIALDKKLNIYYTDQTNLKVVECTNASHYQSCTVLENLGGTPSFLFRDGSGNLWVSDQSCSGFVWKNGVLQYTLNDKTGAMTISSSNPSKTAHLYLAISGSCGTFPYSFIFDITDGKQLPTPFSPSTTTLIPGLTPSLQFSAFNNGTVYKTTDKV